MKFKTEDDAFNAYMEHLQEDYPFDISEWDRDFSDGFYDWMDTYEVEIDENS